MMQIEITSVGRVIVVVRNKGWILVTAASAALILWILATNALGFSAPGSKPHDLNNLANNSSRHRSGGGTFVVWAPPPEPVPGKSVPLDEALTSIPSGLQMPRRVPHPLRLVDVRLEEGESGVTIYLTYAPRRLGEGYTLEDVMGAGGVLIMAEYSPHRSEEGGKETLNAFREYIGAEASPVDLLLERDPTIDPGDIEKIELRDRNGTLCYEFWLKDGSHLEVLIPKSDKMVLDVNGTDVYINIVEDRSVPTFTHYALFFSRDWKVSYVILGSPDMPGSDFIEMVISMVESPPPSAP